MDFVRWVFLKSTVIKRAGYNEEEKIMFVEVDNKNLYYKDVPEETYRSLISSPSPGKYYQENIRNKFQRMEV